MAAGNIERFNGLVGAIFAKLYEEFPVPLDLEVDHFGTEMAVGQPEQDGDYRPNRSDARFFVSTVIWLSNHDYIDCGAQVNSGVMDCVLTARTLELLKRMPSNLESTDPSLGDQLVSATKDGMTGKVKELASDFLSKAVGFGTKAATDWMS